TCPHAGMEKTDECVEAVFVGANDKAAERRGKQSAPSGFTFLNPGGVGGAFSGAAFERDQTPGSRIVGGERFLCRQRSFPRIVDAESHCLVTTLENSPTFRIGARRKIAEPEEDAVFWSGPCEEPPGE